MKKQFSGRIVKGRLQLAHPDAFRAYTASMKEGEDVYLSVSKRFKERSLDQNAYYWGVVIPLLSGHIGYFEDEMHEAMKLKFLYREVPGKIPTIVSTARLSTKEFSEYIDRIIAWAAQMDPPLVIPLPNEPIEL